MPISAITIYFITICVGRKVGDLTTLRKLDLSHNYLVTLPESMAKMREITYLNVSDNRLQDFPMILTDMGQLKHLDLRYIVMVILRF